MQGNIPLVKAGEMGNLPVTQALICARADVNARGKVTHK